jgi:flagellin-like protein
MTLNERFDAIWSRDEGVSPVIAVILMVAITVVLAATVYVWVSGFANEQDSPEQASAAASGIDLDDDGDVEWVKVSLTAGENTPYDQADVTASATAQNGTSIDAVCEDAQGVTWGSGTLSCDGDAWAGGDSWDTGENLYVPCLGDGNHPVTFSVRGTTILDTNVVCDTDVS